MIKRLICVLLLTASFKGLALARSVRSFSYHHFYSQLTLDDVSKIPVAAADTTKTKKQQEAEDKKKIKEIAKARRHTKPEKLAITPIDTISSKMKIKQPRQRRPDGLVRPPEIPRRNNN